MSDTTRTDAAAIGFARILVDHEKHSVTELVDANFARNLERALAKYEQAELPEEPLSVQRFLYSGVMIPGASAIESEAFNYIKLLRAHDARVTVERDDLIANLEKATLMINDQVKAIEELSKKLGQEHTDHAAATERAEKAEGAVLWVLWGHQGGSSQVGQPLRKFLGIGAYDRLTDEQLASARRFAAETGGGNG